MLKELSLDGQDKHKALFELFWINNRFKNSHSILVSNCVDVVVAVSRNNGVPPAPPTLAITSTTGSTISLGWTPAPDGGAPLIAYHIHYHREFGDWDRVTILTIIFMANLPKKLEHFWI